MNSEEKLIGYIGVDAGLCMVGDPCYASRDDDKATSSHPIHDWPAFCKTIQEWRDEHPDEPAQMQLPYAHGHAGLGVVVESGFGDGMYPVYATVTDHGSWGKRVTQLRVDFDPSDGENDDDS